MPKDMRGVMDEFKHGELHSGSSQGPVVNNRKQAIAIGLSEQRKMRGESVPGMMATRNALRGIRNDSIRHIPKSKRRGVK